MEQVRQLQFQLAVSNRLISCVDVLQWEWYCSMWRYLAPAIRTALVQSCPRHNVAGHLGVPLFFVISGFCIHLRWAKQQARAHIDRPDVFEFWKRRRASALSSELYRALLEHVNGVWRISYRQGTACPWSQNIRPSSTLDAL
jgi:hypothetical protein